MANIPAAPLMRDISDTAWWVATYRAMESERPDAIFHDPYARRLSGDRGEEMVRSLKRGRSIAWPMIVRTAVFDELILRAIERDGVDTVLNLAAGLDARPYRLPLPPTLRWIDVDLPGILDYKADMLTGERPVCRLETVRLDLSDIAARRTLFARVNSEAKQVLVVTEGLLVYLPSEDVTSLATDLFHYPTFRWWLSDLTSPAILRMIQRSWQAQLPSSAKMQFAPADGPAFFERVGWRVSEFRLTLDEAHRLHREMPMAWMARLMTRLYSLSPKKAAEWRTGFLLLKHPPDARPSA